MAKTVKAVIALRDLASASMPGDRTVTRPWFIHVGVERCALGQKIVILRARPSALGAVVGSLIACPTVTTGC